MLQNVSIGKAAALLNLQSMHLYEQALHAIQKDLRKKDCVQNNSQHGDRGRQH